MLGLGLRLSPPSFNRLFTATSPARRDMSSDIGLRPASWDVVSGSVTFFVDADVRAENDDACGVGSPFVEEGAEMERCRSRGTIGSPEMDGKSPDGVRLLLICKAPVVGSGWFGEREGDGSSITVVGWNSRAGDGNRMKETRGDFARGAVQSDRAVWYESAELLLEDVADIGRVWVSAGDPDVASKTWTTCPGRTNKPRTSVEVDVSDTVGEMLRVGFWRS